MSINSDSNYPQNDHSKQDVRKEMILYFYSSMLQYIIQKKEITIKESVQSIPSAERVLIGQRYKESEPNEESEPTEESEQKVLIEEVEESEPIIRNIKIKSSIILKHPKKNLLMMKKSLRKNLKLNTKSTKQFLGTNTSLERKSSYTPTNNWILDHTEENVKIKFRNGNKYEGTTFCNMLHGKGKYTWANGAVYEGEFKNNEITGVGRYKFPDQTIYSGDVYKHYCHGSGVLLPAMSPCIYKGKFYLNVKQGFGWQLFSNNNVYEGEWFDDQMNGGGHRKYPSGAEYYGKFIMGKRHGYGVAVLKNQDMYAGEWAQGERDGFGDYVWNVQNEHYFAVPVQNCYYGSWVNNKRDGIGVINFGMEGGSRYAGYFSNNEKHGSGVIICENGHVIESNPLFINDKPVHVTDTANLENLQTVNSTVDLSFKEDETSRSLSATTNLDYTNETSLEECLLRKFPLAGKLQFAPSSVETRSSTDTSKTFKQKQNLDNSDVYDKTFPKIMDQYSSLKIPIGVSCELIDLNTHIYKIIEYKSSPLYLNKIKENNDSESLDKFVSPSSSDETYSDYELHEFEEKLIRRSISKYLSYLKRIYNLYAKIGCIEKNTTFKPWMMRIFFWQLCRDCKFPEKGISLIDIDLMFSEKSTFNCNIVHNPFEIIYFWQYLETLLHVALALYGEVFIYGDDGILKQSFECLVENDIMPNAGHFTGSALFDYKDVLPLKAAYDWYKKIGEPLSVKDLYRNIFTLGNKRRPGHNEEVLDLPNIRTGRNVINCGNKIFYFEDKEGIFVHEPIEENIKSIQYENTNKLYFLANLKPKDIRNNIISVCPSIKDNKDIINFEYKLSFLEFYEIILLCIQKKIKRPNLKKPKLSMELPSIKAVKFSKKNKRSFSRKSKKAQG